MFNPFRSQYARTLWLAVLFLSFAGAGECRAGDGGPGKMNPRQTEEFVEAAWDYSDAAKGPVVAALEEYIRIPNLSPAFDPDWPATGDTDKATAFLTGAARATLEWAAAKGTDTSGITMRVIGDADSPVMNAKGERRTPLLRIDMPAFGDAPPSDTILLYGHLDKQPSLLGAWSPGLHPYQPVFRDERLYGRGGADDGYGMFSALTAVLALRAQNVAHARCVIVIEACEESGSVDLEYYIREMRPDLGEVNLVICLDSGAGDYERLWTTDSLRGILNGTLKIDVMRDAVHSGEASGVVPSPFRILRLLLDRIEDAETGALIPSFLRTDIPADAVRQAERVAAVSGKEARSGFPFLADVRTVDGTPVELTLNRTWRGALVVKGMDGFPPNAIAGNLLLPGLAAGLSLRLPPTVDAAAAGRATKALLEKDPPYGAKVEFVVEVAGDGFSAPEGEPWLTRAVDQYSREFFGTGRIGMGEGGSIPFMGMLGALFPEAGFLITGILGPGSNAHGPDESLHIPYAQKITMCVAGIIAAHADSAK